MKEQRFEFSHRVTVFVFLGKHLEPPAAGTYDATKWTPPTRQVFRVEIQSDGMWRILLQGVDIAFGDNGKPTRKAAHDLLIDHCSKYL